MERNPQYSEVGGRVSLESSHHHPETVRVSGLSGYGGGLVECCQYRVDPLLLLGLIAAIGGLTFFLQQQGQRVKYTYTLQTLIFFTVVANINGKRSLREEMESWMDGMADISGLRWATEPRMLN